MRAKDESIWLIEYATGSLDSTWHTSRAEAREHIRRLKSEGGDTPVRRVVKYTPASPSGSEAGR